MSVTLRPYQEKIVDLIRDAYRTGSDFPLVVLPTGGGKTTIFASVTASANKKGNTVFLLCHRAELVKQIADTLARFEVLHNIIAPNTIINQCRLEQWKSYGASFVDYKAKVFVCSVQTLVKRLDKMQYLPDLIVCDEAHHLTKGSTWGKCIDHYPNARTLLVTATPCRLDGKGLGKPSGYADKLIIGQEMRWLIDNGYLCEYKYFGIPSNIDLRNVKKIGGDYKVSELETVIDTPKIIGDAVEHYNRLAKGKRAVVFCCTIKHANHVADNFNAVGIKAEVLEGATELGERKLMIERFRAGETLILCSCSVISEGFDLPAIEVAILLRPTSSISLYLQQVGRALRMSDGKDYAIIIDHVGNIRHGFPDDERTWSLDGEVKNKTNPEEKDIKIKTCLACFMVFKSGDKCPYCHTRVEIKNRKLSEGDGILVELTRDEKKIIKEAEEFEKLVESKKRKTEEGQCKTLDDFIELGKDRGYKYPEAWAEKRYSFRRKI